MARARHPRRLPGLLRFPSTVRVPFLSLAAHRRARGATRHRARAARRRARGVESLKLHGIEKEKQHKDNHLAQCLL